MKTGVIHDHYLTRPKHRNKKILQPQVEEQGITSSCVAKGGYDTGLYFSCNKTFSGISLPRHCSIDLYPSWRPGILSLQVLIHATFIYINTIPLWNLFQFFYKLPPLFFVSFLVVRRLFFTLILPLLQA